MRKMMLQIGAVSLFAVVIAAGLSLVPRLDQTVQTPPDAPVFRSDVSVTLTTRNLVDVMLKSPLHLHLAHVEWSNAILSVDLTAADERIAVDHVYSDLYALARMSFSSTRNVKRLLVRVVEPGKEPGGVPQLLLAMDAKREDLDLDEQKSDHRSKLTEEQFVSSHFSLTYTHKWLDRSRR